MDVGKKIILGILAILVIAGGNGIYAQTIAFPGAEGYGRIATGGRGTLPDGRKMFLDAQVVEVTNLEDYGEGEEPIKGSFRWALDQQDTLINGTTVIKIPTTIVFRVGGVIKLKEDIKVAAKNLTIAGQTALGSGICFRGKTLNFNGSQNLIVRYISSRPGDEESQEVSAFRIENGADFIIDHCTFSWAIEEVTHFSNSPNLTVQWCIVSESLYNSIHKKGPRGYATQWGGEYASYHHNLLAHHNSRMPRINGSNPNDIESLVDYRNNVNFNWGNPGAFYGGEWEGTDGKGFCRTNVVNNYFKKGSATSGNHFAKPSLNRGPVQLDGYAQWYFSGNVMEGNSTVTNDNWLGVDASEVGGKDNIKSDIEFVKSDGIFEQYSNYTESAEQTFASVLNGAGASFPERNAHDIRLIQEIKGEKEIVRYSFTTNDGQSTPQLGVKSGLIDTQKNLVSPEDRDAGKDAWTVLEAISEFEAPVDTDHDGIPDDWEKSHDLNPNDGSDFRIITPSGYTFLEVYLADLIGDIIDYNTPVTGIDNDLNSQPGLKLFPNPCSDQIFFNTKNKITSVKIYDLSGRQVVDESNIEGIGSIFVGLLKEGCYIVKVETEKQNILVSKLLRNRRIS